MTTGTNNKLIAVLVGLLVVVTAVQSVIMIKLYQRSPAPDAKSAIDPILMEVQPKTGPVPSSPGGTPKPQWNPPVPSLPFGRFGYTPGIWDPFQEFRSMRQQMDQMFNDSFGRFQQTPDFESLWGQPVFSPSMDLEEKTDRYIVRFDVPGVDKSNITINLEDRQLTVSGQVEESVEHQDATPLRRERRSGRFERFLTLPGPVQSDGMEAEYEDGVLIVTLLKGEAAAKSATIQVQ